MRIIDRVGKRYGTLTVLKFSHKSKFGNACWLCACDCGKQVIECSNHLPTIKSCGCERTKHGHYVGKASRTYKTWDAMLTRCNNPNSKSYKYYGALGVKVAERWYSFANFLDDMGERPEGKTLDRLNPWGNYEPNNCVWADKYEQANNKRASHHHVN